MKLTNPKTTINIMNLVIPNKPTLGWASYEISVVGACIMDGLGHT